jgi:hypothetical protein
MEVVSCLAQIVSKLSTLPDEVNAEHIAVNKNHIYMNKFGYANDEDFQMISSHLRIMVEAAKRRIDANWESYRGGGWLEKSRGGYSDDAYTI